MSGKLSVSFLNPLLQWASQMCPFVQFIQSVLKIFMYKDCNSGALGKRILQQFIILISCRIIVET